MVTVVSERDAIVEFLQLYRGLTCLWDHTDELYCSKDARNKALQKLADKLKAVDPNASPATTKKKLENMRAAYKREWKKVQNSKHSGAGSSEIYVPALWYYEYLTFLNEKASVTRNGVDACVDEDDSEVSETQKATPIVRGKRRRTSEMFRKREKLIEAAHSLLSMEENPADAYGRSVGLQLGEMSYVQRCIAEKLISDVMFYGKLGKLSLQSSVTNTADDTPITSPSPSSSGHHTMSRSTNGSPMPFMASDVCTIVTI